MHMTDEDAIRNTIARFCQCLDSRQFEAWSQTFTESGVFGRLNGRAAILAMILEGELANQPDLQATARGDQLCRRHSR